MKILNKPRFIPRAFYQETLDKAADYLMSFDHVVAVYTARDLNGDIINGEGLSDLDIFYVVDESKVKEFVKVELWDNPTRDESYILDHELGLPITESLLKKLVYFYSNYGQGSEFVCERGSSINFDTIYESKSEELILWGNYLECICKVINPIFTFQRTLKKEQVYIKNVIKFLYSERHVLKNYNILGLPYDQNRIDRAEYLYKNYFKLDVEFILQEAEALVGLYYKESIRLLEEINCRISANFLDKNNMENIDYGVFSISHNRHIIFSDKLFNNREEKICYIHRKKPIEWINQKIFSNQAPSLASYKFAFLPKNIFYFIKATMYFNQGMFGEYVNRNLHTSPKIKNKSFFKKEYQLIAEQYIQFQNEYWSFCKRYHFGDYGGPMKPLIFLEDGQDSSSLKNLYKKYVYCPSIFRIINKFLE